MSLLISTTAVTDPTKNQITQSNTYMSNLTILQISLQIPKTIEKRLSQLSSSEKNIHQHPSTKTNYTKIKYANTEIHNK